MTGYTVHTGSTEKFTQGWDEIFKKAKPKKAAPAHGTKRKPAKKKGKR